MRPERYCPVCGWIRDIPDPNNEIHICTYCHHEMKDAKHDFAYYSTKGEELYTGNPLFFLASVEAHRVLTDEEISKEPLFNPELCAEREKSEELQLNYAIKRDQKIKAESLKPKCPTCNSTNVVKISGTKRFVSVGFLGLASSNIGKTMECKNCGYKW